MRETPQHYQLSLFRISLRSLSWKRKQVKHILLNTLVINVIITIRANTPLVSSYILFKVTFADFVDI